jgi:alkylhydroperoxidase family enzyme
MNIIEQKDYDSADAIAKAEWDGQITAHGRMTNMKRTLAHNGVALRAYMEWYPLKTEVQKLLGERATIIFVHAISGETDCLICSTFFRRILIEWDENPDELVLNDQEKLLVRYGLQLVQNPHLVSEDLLLPLKEWLGEEGLVTLTAFGGIMIATNVFNNALKIPLDDYLEPFRKK